MAAKAARDAKLNAARAEMLQALRKAEAKVAANTAPATWETYLPERLKNVKIEGEPASDLLELLRKPEPARRPLRRQLTPEEMARIDAMCCTKEDTGKQKKGPGRPRKDAAKKAKKEKVAGTKAAAAAADTPAADALPPPPGVSAHGRRALDAVWALEFGPDKTNPFRTRLAKDACEALGMPDYHDVVDTVADLALAREKVNKGQYYDDAALRHDVRLMAANARAYHGAESDVAKSGERLAAAFDTVLGGGDV
mmetsp:Transcript_25951/g.79810  ORF Transcript_25951/g.79810 Transcript_25951/m.79810 type:complete len:253 (+) Transcript_25951:1672-2430(+)